MQSTGSSMFYILMQVVVAVQGLAGCWWQVVAWCLLVLGWMEYRIPCVESFFQYVYETARSRTAGGDATASSAHLECLVCM